MAKLVVKEGFNIGTEYGLTGDRAEIGRSRSCLIRLMDTDVSRTHAEMRKSGDDWILIDLGSRNGTLVNGKKVKEVKLKASDEISLGNTVLVFLDGDAELAPQEDFVFIDEGETALPETATPLNSPEVVAEPEAEFASAAGLKSKAKPERETAAPPPKTADTKRAQPKEVKLDEPSPPKPPAAKSKTAPEARIPPGIPKEKGEALLKLLDSMKGKKDLIIQEMHKVIIGQNEVIEQILIAMFSRGHCLMVGVPGLAKTLMVRTIADVLDLNFRRIQFTPDLMPSDITGTDILEEDETTQKKSFRFIKGPIFTNILLADEINRTPPKTQSALLEAMQEYRVTASGYTYDLELPFFVLATQNPLEQEGTYPLPEAQLDRFMFNIFVDYPKREEEEAIVKATTYDTDSEVKKILGGKDILRLQQVVRRIPVSNHVIKYATSLVRATRPNTEEAPDFINEWVSCGAGPRATQYLILSGKARAVMNARYNVSCADIRAAAIPVMRHRIFTNFNADSEGIKSTDIIEKLLKTVPEPTEKDYKK